MQVMGDDAPLVLIWVVFIYFHTKNLQNLLKLIGKWVYNIIQHKVNIQNSIVFLCTSNELLEIKNFKVSFTIAYTLK